MRSELALPAKTCPVVCMVLYSVLRLHMAVVLAFADLNMGCLAVEKIVVSQNSRGHHRNAEGGNACHDVLHDRRIYCLQSFTWLSMSCTEILGSPFCGKHS